MSLHTHRAMPAWIARVKIVVEPIGLRPIVMRSHFYCISSIAYSLAGLQVLVSSSKLKIVSNFFPWQTFGCLLMLQGIVSYLADVKTWGVRSMWKFIDKLLATGLTICCVILASAHMCAQLCLEWSYGVTFAAAIVVALECKRRSSKALLTICSEPAALCELNAYLFWHTAWHVSLPVVSIFIIQLLP